MNVDPNTIFYFSLAGLPDTWNPEDAAGPVEALPKEVIVDYLARQVREITKAKADEGIREAVEEAIGIDDFVEKLALVPVDNDNRFRLKAASKVFGYDTEETRGLMGVYISLGLVKLIGVDRYQLFNTLDTQKLYLELEVARLREKARAYEALLNALRGGEVDECTSTSSTPTGS